MIRVGLVGYGLAGAVFHAPLIASVEGLALAGVATTRARLVKERWPDVPVLPAAQLLRDPGLRLIVIATPTQSHFELARAALEAGKHVVVDKPFTVTAAEAEELIALARRRQLMLSVFQNRRWDNDFLTIRRCLEQGGLGEVCYYEAHFDRFRPEIKAGWREEPGPGTGILYDLGSHLIDQALVLFGRPEAVTADVQAQRSQAKVADYFHLILHYGRRRAVLHASTLAPSPGPRFVVHGDAGSLIKYGLDPQEAALAAGAQPGARGWGQDPPESFATLTAADGSSRRLETVPGAYQDYYRGVVACLERGAPSPVDPAQSRDGLRLIAAAERSSAEGRRVVL